MNKIITAFCCLIFLSGTLSAQTGLPFGRTSLFAGSGSCGICHSSDLSTVLFYNGEDISPVTHWRSTMMGNASKEPFWRAVVAEEVHKFPQLQQVIESTCTKCHSPMGYTEAIYNGQQHYSMSELNADPIANDGVSCTACHQIKPDNFGSADSYSGNYIIEDDSVNYGPYENPHTQAMFSVIGFNPVYSSHVDKSELCATCHTLFTPYIDNQGNIAGEFPEQTPYLEWKNSQYPAQDIQCQDCHMPVINDGIDIATIPPGHQVLRSPYWRHEFVGGNIYMLGLLKNNIDALGLSASAADFDRTIGFAGYNLTEKTIDLSVSADVVNDSLEIKVRLENKTGHKIPSGIPFRRMWVNLVVEDADGIKVFESGAWDADGEITGLDAGFEQHYNIISDPDQVQVYEGVLIDVDQNVTYTLLRAAEYAKDNRIPPKGFLSTHPSYDTTAVIGLAAVDPDFNRDGSVEGSGADIVTYRIAAASSQEYDITVRICFQSIKPAVVNYLRNVNEPVISQFVAMYDNYPNTPFIIKEQTASVVTSVGEQSGNSLTEYALDQNYPNPFNPVTKISFTLPFQGMTLLKVYDVVGNEIVTLADDFLKAGMYEYQFDASELSSGIYYYTLRSGSFVQTRKMVLIK